MSRGRLLIKGALSLIVALALSVTLALQFFYSTVSSPLDWIALLLIPTAAFALLIYLSLPTAQKGWQESGRAARIVVGVLTLATAGMWAMSTSRPGMGGMAFLSSAALAAGLMLPTAPSIQRLVEARAAARGALSGLLGAGLAYLLVGFLERFYSASLQGGGLAFAFAATFSTLLFYLLKDVGLSWKRGFLRHNFARAQVGLLLLFVVAVGMLCLQFPNLFDVDHIALSSQRLPHAVTGMLIGVAWSARMREEIERRGWIVRLGQSGLTARLRAQFPGLFLAAAMFFVYGLLGLTLNPPAYNTNNVFFAADAYSWRLRLATQGGYLVSMRAVHPLAFLLIRPLVGTLTLVTNGDWYYAALLAVALAGSASVYLCWHLIMGFARRPEFAFSFAAILGISATYLVFASLIESYVFSSLGLLLFCVLLQKHHDALSRLVPAGILTFGITLTNFAQSVLLLVFYNPRAKLVARYVVLVLSASVLLSIIQLAIFPASRPFFSPSDLAVERASTQSIFQQTPSKAWRRVYLVAREVALYSVVAPIPYQTWVDKEARGAFPKFNFFAYRKEDFLYSEYRGAGTLVAWMWVALVLGAALLFLWNLFSRRKQGWMGNKFSLGLLANLAYNFALHLNYGYEPFLYAANWTYALLLFVSLSWGEVADRRWLQAFLLAFLLFLMANNLGFMLTLMEGLQALVSAPP